ncbi:hypothetical protein IW261DRAFT_1571998 [Armillaria novae-zelandiae]|uniref:Uncharacterized protein n=1 Tax=Armillaria novae-zelandiae TaxID=153914 RepID=A0AA39NTD5_9AGAR|nr:hypothetical protein IW261DRAFT_1571998 [Armillaria novae-zelandiae]
MPSGKNPIHVVSIKLTRCNSPDVGWLDYYDNVIDCAKANMFILGLAASPISLIVSVSHEVEVTFGRSRQYAVILGMIIAVLISLAVQLATITALNWLRRPSLQALRMEGQSPWS